MIYYLFITEAHVTTFISLYITFLDILQTPEIFEALYQGLEFPVLSHRPIMALLSTVPEDECEAFAIL